MGRLKRFFTSIWDSKQKKFCGRGGRNWVPEVDHDDFQNAPEKSNKTEVSKSEICAFFIVFYAILLAYFCGMLSIFYNFVSDEKPVLVGKHGFLTTPGLSVRPRLKAGTDYTTFIYFSDNARDKYSRKAIDSLKQALLPYTHAHEDNYANFWMPCTPETKITHKKPCVMDYGLLAQGDCNERNNFGFNIGQPCVLLRINRIIDWEPQPFTRPVRSMSPELKAFVNQYDVNMPTSFGNLVWLDCFGQDPVDKQRLGSLRYQPFRGFPVYYFPYVNQYRYLSPAIFVQFLGLTPGLAIKVHCRIFAKNVKFDDSTWDGGFHFELFYNKTTP